MRQPDREDVYRAFELWVDAALRGDDSLFTPGATVWALDVINDLYEHFNMQPDTGSTSFEDKFKRQLDGSSPETIQLAGELVFMHLLIAADIKGATKRGLVTRILSWSATPVSIPATLDPALERGLASTGPAFKTFRPQQLWFLIEFSRKWKALPEAERDRCLRDPWAFRSLVYEIPIASAYSQREALFHMVFPQVFEDIVSRDHKDRIVHAFADRVSDPGADYDRKLLEIRESLTKEIGRPVSFYDPEQETKWRSEPSGQSASPDAREQPISWWVNQGRTYLQERDGGYMWSPRRSQGAGVGPRPYWTAMTQVQQADRIVHYRNGAIRAVSRAVSSADEAKRPGELPKEAWEEEGWLVRTEYQELAEPIPLDSIGSEWRVPESGPFNVMGRVQQGYLFRVSEEFGKELAQMLNERQLVRPGTGSTMQPGDDPLTGLVDRTFLDRTQIEELIELVQTRRQVILHGPPGSGKTWVAEALARFLTDNPLEGEETNTRLELVQFHQSYGYEDFMQGIRPITTEGTLEYRVLPGILMRFIGQDGWDPDADYVLVIDEINRGNISRIFGELLLLLEYREKEIRLPYAEADASKFRLPANLLIIGTMNTADRSLASIDYALRRRFAFHRLSPVEHGRAPVLEKWLNAQPKVTADQRAEVLVLFLGLNQRVEDEMGSGGEDFQIGHSYFMNQQVFTEAGRARIWRTSIRPLLEEYFANRKERSQLLDQFEPSTLLASGSPGSVEPEIEEDAE